MKVRALLVIAVTVCSLGADAPAAPTELQGLWALVSVEANGIVQSGEGLQIFKQVFIGNQYFAAVPAGPVSGTFKIVSAEAPKSIDFFPADGPQKGMTIPCVYQLEGDTLKLGCSAGGDPSRPKEVTGKAGSNCVLVTYKRVQP